MPDTPITRVVYLFCVFYKLSYLQLVYLYKYLRIHPRYYNFAYNCQYILYSKHTLLRKDTHKPINKLTYTTLNLVNSVTWYVYKKDKSKQKHVSSPKASVFWRSRRNNVNNRCPLDFGQQRNTYRQTDVQKYSIVIY